MIIRKNFSYGHNQIVGDLIRSSGSLIADTSLAADIYFGKDDVYSPTKVIRLALHLVKDDLLAANLSVTQIQHYADVYSNYASMRKRTSSIMLSDDDRALLSLIGKRLNESSLKDYIQTGRRGRYRTPEIMIIIFVLCYLHDKMGQANAKSHA